VSDLGPLSEIVCVRGDSFAISGPTGDIGPGGDQGVYVRDTRVLDRLEVRVDGQPPTHLSGASIGGHRAIFHAYLPSTRDAEVDPTVSVTRHRVVDGGVREELVFANQGTAEVELAVEVRVGTDFAYVFDVKHGRLLTDMVPTAEDDRVVFTRPGGEERTEVRVPGAQAADGRLTTRIHLAAGSSVRMSIEVRARDPAGWVGPGPLADASVTAPALDVAGPPLAPAPRVRCSDERFARLLRRSVADLHSLELTDPDEPADRFVAAGSPWFLTLFGRDSIWAASMALPADLDLAGGTLRALARRQGTREDPETEEEPGKILHEVRRGALADRGDLPPFYYGTVDATPLFVVLAHEAWCWGLPEHEVRALLPHVEAALGWMAAHGTTDGFLSYVPHGERTLANQGWKDSQDGIRFRDGTIARAPLALCEVQGYGYDAAIRGAELLERFGRPGAARWRTWAAELRDRFRAAFWVADDRGPYPAVALDGDGARVDGLASNMGHLLGTGILDDDETAAVADRLAGSDLQSGWGLRTLSTSNGGYNPLSYHCGSVWPHDTAIAAWGLARTGHAAAATTLLRGLVRAAPTFNFRLPELFTGFAPADAPLPVPYPAACRPQAWAAGGALLLARAVFGVDARVPDGRLRVQPLDPAPFERLDLEEVPLAGGHVDLRLRDGRVSVEVRDTDLVVEVVHR
jgi:glycogen debranching enzyme